MKDKNHEAQLMDQFLCEIDALGPNATLYCNGWWQEAEVTLVLNRPMISVDDVIQGKEVLDTNTGYFIVGRRFDMASTEEIANMLNVNLVEIDDINVDYNMLYPFNSYELFSIYKIEKK